MRAIHRCKTANISLLQEIQITFTFLLLPFWYQLTQVVLDKIQRAVKWL